MTSDITSQDTDEADQQPADPVEEIELTIKHGSQQLRYRFHAQGSTLADLADRISEDLSIPLENQKYIISPKPGLIRLPFVSPEQANLSLTTIASRKISLLGNTPEHIASLNKTIESSKARSSRAYNGPIKAATPARARDWKRLHDETTYTFLQIRPLPYLPNPERSTKFLERLRDDPGIKATMAKHKWAVPLLTEMNPADHTTHDGRTLGLNRNAGEVIELRLRTDAYDGYRDYKTIRKTLCHELTHNVHGEHDQDFWALCHTVEKEVEQADWKGGGRALTEEVFHESDSHSVADHGAWTGGEYVLGSSASSGASSSHVSAGQTLTRREVLAKAAEARAKNAKNHRGNEGPSTS